MNYDTTGNYMCYKLLVRVKSLLNMALWLYSGVRCTVTLGKSNCAYFTCLVLVVGGGLVFVVVGGGGLHHLFCPKSEVR